MIYVPIRNSFGRRVWDILTRRPQLQPQPAHHFTTLFFQYKSPGLRNRCYSACACFWIRCLKFFIIPCSSSLKFRSYLQAAVLTECLGGRKPSPSAGGRKLSFSSFSFLCPFETYILPVLCPLSVIQVHDSIRDRYSIQVQIPLIRQDFFDFKRFWVSSLSLSFFSYMGRTSYLFFPFLS